jgi:hypothetical protein
VAALEFGSKTPLRALSAFSPAELPADVTAAAPVLVQSVRARPPHDFQAFEMLTAT